PHPPLQANGSADRLRTTCLCDADFFAAHKIVPLRQVVPTRRSHRSTTEPHLAMPVSLYFATNWQPRTPEGRHVNPLDAFALLELGGGRVRRAEPNSRARKPAYKLWIDFGAAGVKTSSAQLTVRYAAQELIGRQVVAAINLGTRSIAGFASEVLVLGL